MVTELERRNLKRKIYILNAMTLLINSLRIVNAQVNCIIYPMIGTAWENKIALLLAMNSHERKQSEELMANINDYIFTSFQSFLHFSAFLYFLETYQDE